VIIHEPIYYMGVTLTNGLYRPNRLIKCQLSVLFCFFLLFTGCSHEKEVKNVRVNIIFIIHWRKCNCNHYVCMAGRKCIKNIIVARDAANLSELHHRSLTLYTARIYLVHINPHGMKTL